MPAAPGGSGVGGENGNQPQPSQAAWRKHHTVFTNEKAGMAGVDREHVQKVVFDMSKVRKSSPSVHARFQLEYQHEQRYGNGAATIESEL